MVINVASFGGRSHLLDTARELAKQGHTVRFYSYVPTKRAVQFGLPAECNYSLFYWALPFLAIYKVFGYRHWCQYLYWRVFDVFTAFYMKPCDVFIGQSPMHYRSLHRAKKKWNALTILERGTSHVIEYDNHLLSIPLYKRHNKYTLHIDMRAYSVADYISVGAHHVKKSFMIHGFPQEKIFVNNYGFDQAQFHATTLKGDYDIIMVGTWGYRKGCDFIIEACRQKGYRCLHVGACMDIEMPTDVQIMDIGTVPQQELYKYYEQAKVFVLPSREEGLAMVQMQAVACGLPIVCSPYSGGRDIRKYCVSDDWIIEMKELSTEALIEGIDKALEKAATQTGMRNYLNEHFTEASWDGYGRRYNEFLKSKVKS